MLEKIKAIFAGLIMEWHKLTGNMQAYITIALHITGTIAAVAENATVDTILSVLSPAISKLLPNAELMLNAAISALMGLQTGSVADTKQLLAEFINWLNTQPAFTKNAMLHKLASIIVSLLDSNAQSEAYYDKQVQDRIITAKIADTPLINAPIPALTAAPAQAAS